MSLIESLDAVGESIIAWSRPEGWPEHSPAAKWPLASFSSAAIIAAGYLAFVFLGTICTV
jgi:hypothetical protein